MLRHKHAIAEYNKSMYIHMYANILGNRISTQRSSLANKVIVNEIIACSST